MPTYDFTKAVSVGTDEGENKEEFYLEFVMLDGFVTISMRRDAIPALISELEHTQGE